MSLKCFLCESEKEIIEMPDFILEGQPITDNHMCKRCFEVLIQFGMNTK